MRPFEGPNTRNPQLALQDPFGTAKSIKTMTTTPKIPPGRIDGDVRSSVHGARRPPAYARQEREGLRCGLYHTLADPQPDEEREVQANSGRRGRVGSFLVKG